jgi:hypothetical protein
VVLQAGGSMQLASPWRRELVAMQQHADKIQHEDEDQGATINESMDLLMRMRSQAQSTAAAGATPGDDASGSDAENVPEENLPIHFPMDEHDTVCCGDADSELDTALTVAPHMHVPHAEQQNCMAAQVQQGNTAVHEDGSATAVTDTAVGLSPSGVCSTPKLSALGIALQSLLFLWICAHIHTH